MQGVLAKYWRRWLGSILWAALTLPLVVVVIFSVLSWQDTKTFLTAEKVKVHVDWCGYGEPHAFGAGSSGLAAAPQARYRSGGGGRSKHCIGSWTFRDGTTGKGNLRTGILGDTPAVGSTRVMRATSTTAVSDNPWQMLAGPIITPFALVALTLSVRRWWRRRKANSDDPPSADNMPGPAPPAYPRPLPQAYPAPTGYPGSAPPAYPGPVPQAYPVPHGYPGPGPQGYPGPAASGYPRPAPQGYPGPVPQGGPSPWAPPDRYPRQG